MDNNEQRLTPAAQAAIDAYKPKPPDEPQAEPAMHTPGPWVVNINDYRMLFEIASAPEGKPQFFVAQTGSDHKIDEANARLIAAAPDMLAALKQAVSRADDDLKSFALGRTDECARDYVMCVAAIAKAESR